MGKKIIRVILIAILVLAIFLAGCNKGEKFDYKIYQIEIGGITVNAEVADTPAKSTQGLMYRKHLGEFKGMLFFFPIEQELTFWMKNTLIPLDIIFIDSNNTIVKIHQAEPCKSDPCTKYSSGNPSVYVLEVNKGFAEKYNIEEGYKVTIVRSS